MTDDWLLSSTCEQGAALLHGKTFHGSKHGRG
jgi:hypothetical protein